MVPFGGCSQAVVMSLLVAAMLFFGLISGGDVPLPAEMSEHFPATLFSLINTASASSGFVAPVLVGWILESGDDIGYLWNVVFMVTAAITMMGAVVFMVFGSAERQSWDRDLDEPRDRLQSCTSIRSISSSVKAF